MGTFTGYLGPFTGEGITPIAGGAGVTPTSIVASVDAITSSRVRVMGTVVPRRLQFAGSFGFAYNEADASATNQDFMVYERIINWEYMDVSLNDFVGTTNQASHIWFRLAPGVSMFLGAWYQ